MPNLVAARTSLLCQAAVPVMWSSMRWPQYWAALEPAWPALIHTVTKLVEKRGTRRVDGVEGATTLSDAVDAKTS